MSRWQFRVRVVGGLVGLALTFVPFFVAPGYIVSPVFDVLLLSLPGLGLVYVCLPREARAAAILRARAQFGARGKGGV